MAYTFQQLVGFAEQGGFPPNVAPTMAAIAMAESSGNNVIQKGQPYATTGYGLWQITPGNSEPQFGVDTAMLNPVNNAKAAYAKYQHQGLGAWTTYKDGAYTKYLNGNPAGVGAATGAAAGAPTGPGFVSSDPLAGVVDSITNSIGAPFQDIAQSFSIINKLSLPQTWVRIGAGVFGLAAVTFGIVFLAREVKS